MLKEAVDYIQVKPDSWYIDANLGGGGHTNEILKQGGKVLGIDLDAEAIEEVANQHKLQVVDQAGTKVAVSDRLILVQANFVNLKEVVEKYQLSNIRGVLFDLGLSSHQLESANRGFSFQQEAKLDMRMNQQSGVTAADLLNGLHETELAELFWKLGEERFARLIAKKIIEQRKIKPIETTTQLSHIISSRVHSKPGEIHPATRVFQALRIAVNDELNSLKLALPQALEVLISQGRIIVISFHSLEDRIVKQEFKVMKQSGLGKILTDKPLIPSDEEINSNPRSRSAKLRCLEKLA